MRNHAAPNHVAASGLVVHLTIAELEARIESAVARALDAQAPKPDYLDRAGLARALDVSVATVARMRAQGCPCVVVGDSPRFRLAHVQKWLESRSKADTP